MTDVHHNSFEDKLARVQADLTGLCRRHQDLHTELRHRLRIPTKSPGYNGMMSPGIPE